VVNPGAADEAQLATEVARLWAQKLDATAALGIGQTWQDVTATRSLGVAYYNTTPKPIQVVLEVQSTTSTSFMMSISVGGVVAVRSNPFTTVAGQYCSISAIVPHGSPYQYAATNAVLSKSTELR